MLSKTIEQWTKNVRTYFVRLTSFGRETKVEHRVDKSCIKEVEPSLAPQQLKCFHAKWMLKNSYALSDWLAEMTKETPTEFSTLRNRGMWPSPRSSAHRKFHRRKTAEKAFLFTIIPFLLITVGQCHPNSSHCFDCDELNRLPTTQCPTAVDECGHCSSGYFDNNGNCVKIEVAIGPPKELKVVEGSDVEIACTFNAKVSCEWKRNGQYMDIGASGSRYRYKSSNECTLVIERLEAIDVGHWQCNVNGLTDSTITKLSMDKKQEVLVHPREHINALYGEPIVLTCSFDEPVVCSWFTAIDEASE